MKIRKLRYSNHALDRMSLRQINKAMIEDCVLFNQKTEQREGRVIVYTKEKLVVVVHHHSGTVISVFWKYEEPECDKKCNIQDEIYEALKNRLLNEDS